ncbi:hypothetical protein [Streptomyces sp. LN704]
MTLTITDLRTELPCLEALLTRRAPGGTAACVPMRTAGYLKATTAVTAG